MIWSYVVTVTSLGCYLWRYRGVSAYPCRTLPLQKMNNIISHIFGSLFPMVCCHVMLGEVVTIVVCTRLPEDIKLLLCLPIRQPMVSHVPGFGFFCMLLYTKQVAVELSVFRGVGGWGWFNTLRIWQIGIAVPALWNIPATSASAEEDTTCQRVLHLTRMAPFICGCLVMLGWLDRWKYTVNDSSLSERPGKLHRCQHVTPCHWYGNKRRPLDMCEGNPWVAVIFVMSVWLVYSVRWLSCLTLGEFNCWIDGLTVKEKQTLQGLYVFSVLWRQKRYLIWRLGKLSCALFPYRIGWCTCGECCGNL